jgi:hypothetical protein
VRVYQLKGATGAIQPNAFVVTFEEFPSSFDFNDMVLIVRNVKNASQGAALTLVNGDGVPFNDRLVTSRLTGDTTGQITHQRAVLNLLSSGTAAFTVTALTPSGPFTLISPPALPFTLAPGASKNVTVELAATGGTGKILTGSLTITTQGGPATTVVQLAGARTKPEGGNEPNFQEVVNAFGYKTVIVGAGQALNAHGHVAAVGDEVLSPYWRTRLAGAPVVVTQLAAYHTRGNTATLRRFTKGSTTLTQIIKSAGLAAQTLLPFSDGTTAGIASASFTTSSVFGLKIDGESSDPTLNSTTKDVSNGCVAPCGHHVRFWPAKDRAGAIIPGAYLMGMDYSGINYDYQDNIYLVTNIQPE